MRKLRTKYRIRKWTERFCLLVGLGAVATWAGSYICSDVLESWQNYVFERSLRGQPATLMPYLAEREYRALTTVQRWLKVNTPREPTAAPQPQTVRNPNERPGLIGADGLVGRLEIPRLHVRGIVHEGAGEGTFSLGLGHIPGTAFPGQGGNVGVAGHRDGLFRSLRAIGKNDLIVFQTRGGSYAYQVESTQIVNPRDVDVLHASQHPELTLVTCYPFYYIGAAPDRFIVKAREVSKSIPLPGISEFEEQPAMPPTTGQQAAKVAGRPAGVQEYRNSNRRTNARVFFHVSERHSRTLAPGISLGLSWADASRHRLNGWVWIMPDRRTIWLRDQDAREPIVFYSSLDGKKRELVITKVDMTSVTGYLRPIADDSR